MARRAGFGRRRRSSPADGAGPRRPPSRGASLMARYNFRETEAKWQRIWEERSFFGAVEEPGRKKAYVLEMFPYPSGRIHMGHVKNYTVGDLLARVRRAQGYNVL